MMMMMLRLGSFDPTVKEDKELTNSGADLAHSPYLCIARILYEEEELKKCSINTQVIVTSLF